MRDVSSPGVLESPDGVSKRRCDAIVRGSIREPVAWLVDGAGSVGGVLLVPTSSLVRMTDGFFAVSDRLLAPRPLLGWIPFASCSLEARFSSRCP
jgi:hypothetical protein